MDTRPKEYLKPLSKKWWENIWYYYKNFIIVGIIVLIALITFIAECMNSVVNDYMMFYIGNAKQVTFDGEYALEEAFSNMVPDFNGDNKTSVNVELIHLDSSSNSEDMATMFQLADAQMAGSDAVVFMFDEEFLERYSDDGYYDLSEWVEEYNIDEQYLKRYDNGSVYAVEMSDNSIMNSVDGVVADGLYMAVRPLRASDTKKRQILAHKNGLEMARYILSEGKYTPVVHEK